MASVSLCYSHADKLFVRELYCRLKRDGDACEFFVAVLSPGYVRFKWVELERTSAMADDPAGLKRKMRPLLLQPCEIPRFLKANNYIDVSSQTL